MHTRLFIIEDPSRKHERRKYKQEWWIPKNPSCIYSNGKSLGCWIPKTLYRHRNEKITQDLVTYHYFFHVPFPDCLCVYDLVCVLYLPFLMEVVLVVDRLGEVMVFRIGSIRSQRAIFPVFIIVFPKFLQLVAPKIVFFDYVVKFGWISEVPRYTSLPLSFMLNSNSDEFRICDTGSENYPWSDNFNRFLSHLRGRLVGVVDDCDNQKIFEFFVRHQSQGLFIFIFPLHLDLSRGGIITLLSSCPEYIFSNTIISFVLPKRSM